MRSSSSRICLSFAIALSISPAWADEPKNATGGANAPDADATTAEVRGVDFLRDVKPLLRSRCVSCHGPLKQEAGLRLDAAANLLKGADDGSVVVAGDAANSRLIARVQATDADVRMPPTGAALSPAEIATLRDWIDAGAIPPAREAIVADPRDHWSLRKIVPPTRPEVSDRSWPRNWIDDFVLARLEARDWQAAPEASPRQLVRRLFLDLIGLPPTPEELRHWTGDGAEAGQQPGAAGSGNRVAFETRYAALVESLLARPEYGERYARHWLDVVRYADSNGYERDAAKPEVWRYRDYVIAALNQDVPFDRFVMEQIAGDELEDASSDTVIATGIHRLGPWDDEPADFATDRFDQLDDIVRTTCETFLGLTMGCARCHDHKFDPLSQRDYYSLVAVFNPLVRPRNGRTELTLAALPPARRKGLSEEQAKGAVQGYFLHEESPVAPVTRLLARGNPNQPGDEVEPAGPAVLGTVGWKGLDPDQHSTRRRLTLAKWIVDPHHPLTPRVIVNRVWQWHFGEGLVRTPSDFGLLGQPPTHPELLEALAWWFVHEADWSLKELHRVIVSSSTYRQGGQQHADYAAEDPENLLLWHRPARRLEVEPIRDAMLSVSGQLDRRMYGPPIYPLVPPEALESHADKLSIWPKYDAAAASRRTVYAFTKRSLVVPMLEVLDLCDTTRPTAQRSVTTVPTQSLVLFNGGFTIEQAGHFARRLREEAGEDWRAQIGLAWRLALSREAAAHEIDAMLGFIETEVAHQQKLHPQATAAELAAAVGTQLCRVIFNLNEFVYPD
ncbi:MAG: hypothetical protein RI963_2931 [Planctomycetota bacterium]